MREARVEARVDYRDHMPTSLSADERAAAGASAAILPARLGGELDAVWLLGSPARGEPAGHEDSDIDVLARARAGRVVGGEAARVCRVRRGGAGARPRVPDPLLLGGHPDARLAGRQKRDQVGRSSSPKSMATRSSSKAWDEPAPAEPFLLEAAQRRCSSLAARSPASRGGSDQLRLLRCSTRRGPRSASATRTRRRMREPGMSFAGRSRRGRSSPVWWPTRSACSTCRCCTARRPDC